ncbi:MAG TPA: hypothetical protein VK590_06175 [Saprospiraceae bacterium]|nr:hypothetical protein [Saprospiraceae bacterium]
MRTRILSFFGVLFVFLLSASSAKCALFTSNSDGDWNNSAIWNAGASGIPGVNDDVVINHIITELVGPQSCKSLIISSTKSLSLTDPLTVTGNVSGSGTLNCGNTTLTVGGDFLITNFTPGASGVVVLNGTTQSFNAFTYNILDITGGIKTVSGDLTIGIFNNSASGILNMGIFILNAPIINNSGTIQFGGANGFAFPNGTIEYNGTAQTVANGTYNSLVISNTGNKTPDGNITATALSLPSSGNILDMTTNTLTIPDISISNLGTIKFSGATNGRAISSGTVEYNGTNQTITTGSYSTLLTSNSGEKTISGAIPASVVTVSSGTTLVLNAILSISSTMIVNGTLKFGSGIFVDGPGSFTLSGAIEITSIDGIALTAISGNIQSTGTRTFNTSASYQYNGSSLQITGDGLPTMVSILIINNPAHVKLSGDLTATTSLLLTSGCLFTNTHVITANAGFTTSSSNFIVTSNGTTLGGGLVRTVSSGTVFPIGPTPSIYMPLTLTGTGSYGVGMVLTRSDLSFPNSALTYSWDFKSGTGNLDMTYQWPLSARGSTFPTSGSVKVLRYNGTWSSLGLVSCTFTDPSVSSISNAVCCSEYTIGGIDALPIVLNLFTAIRDKRDIKLYWSTASEKNNDFFSIERSNDGFSYTEIGKMEGAGNSLEAKAYQFMDDRALLGNNYYRLKQVDFDGAFSYSDVRVVNMDADSPFTLFPTLVRNNITLHTSSESEFDTDIELISVATGAVLYKSILSAGSSSIDLDLSTVPPGSYVARLLQQGNVFNHLFVKQ